MAVRLISLCLYIVPLSDLGSRGLCAERVRQGESKRVKETQTQTVGERSIESEL